MAAHRLLRRAAKAALYFALGLVLLSIGLRVYSAWQIPKAKRLLLEIKTLKSGQVVDDHLLSILRAHNFIKLEPCLVEGCWYRANYIVWFGSERSDRRDSIIRWLLEHGGPYLGIRPWSVGVVLRLENGRIAEIHSGFMVFESGYGPGGELNNLSRMPISSETSPDFRVGEYARYRDLIPHIQYTSLASSRVVSEAFEANFACVWGIRVCHSGYDLFPTWRSLSSGITEQDRLRQASADPCPVKNMRERVRDLDQIALGTVVNRGPAVLVRIDRILRQRSQLWSQVSHDYETKDFDPRIFPTGVVEGSKVIITTGYECNPLPMNDENLRALELALKEFPPSATDPRESLFPQFGRDIVTIPNPPVPAELRP